MHKTNDQTNKEKNTEWPNKQKRNDWKTDNLIDWLID